MVLQLEGSKRWKIYGPTRQAPAWRDVETPEAKERSTATVAQVDALAEAMGPRWRLMVYFCAYGPMRPEEQPALRRTSVTLDPLAVRITEAGRS